MILTRRDLIFNNYNFSRIVDVLSIKRALLSITNDTIAGRDRLFVRGQRLNPQSIEIDVLLRGDNRKEIEKIRKELVKHLYTKEPGKLYTRDSDLYDIAIFDGEADIAKKLFSAKATLRFRTLYGFRFGQTKRLTVKSGDIIVPNGAVDTRGVFSCDIRKSTGSVKVTNARTGDFVKIDYPFEAGGRLIIDGENELVTVNGYNAMKYVAYESDFFDLVAGEQNRITIEGAAEMDAHYTERWL